MSVAMLEEKLLYELPCWANNYRASYHVIGKVTLWLTQLGKQVTMQVTALEEKLPCGLPSCGKKLPCELLRWRKSVTVLGKKSPWELPC